MLLACSEQKHVQTTVNILLHVHKRDKAIESGATDLAVKAAFAFGLEGLPGSKNAAGEPKGSVTRTHAYSAFFVARSCTE